MPEGRVGLDAPSLSGAFAGGVRWSLGQQVVEQIARFGFTVLLARLVQPDDFGLMGMAFVVTYLAILLADLGVGAALVQRPVIDDRHVRTAFTLSSLAGIVLAACVVACAGPLSAWFDEPRLRPILLLLSATFAFKGIQGAPRDLLRRELRWRAYSLTALGALALGVVVGVVAGFAGAGVWALALYAFVEAAAGMILSLVAARRAGLWRPAVGIDADALRDLGGFTGYVFGVRLMAYGQTTLDNIVVGRLLGTAALGHYSLAYRTMLFPIQKVADVVSSVAFPAFAAVQSDRGRVREGFTRAQQSIALVCFPISIGTLVVASVAVPVVFGPEWTPAIASVQILAANGPRLAFNRLNVSTLQALGTPSRDFWLMAASMPLYALAFIVGTRWGVEGVALGFTVVGFATFPLQVRLVSGALGTKPRSLLAGCLPLAAATAAMGAAVLAVRAAVQPGASDAVELLAGILAGALTYALAVAALCPGVVRQLAADVSRRRSPVTDEAVGQRASAAGRRRAAASRLLFVNENLGGHQTVHLNIRRALEQRPDVDAVFYEVPAPRLPRRLAAAPVPGLALLDADLQPLRYQLAQSAVVRRALPSLLSGVDAVHVYTHNVALLSAGLLRNVPTVVSLDGTNEQNAFRLPYREPGLGTGIGVRAVRRFERQVYEAATLVVTHSRWAAASVERYGVSPDRIRVIPFGVTVTDRCDRRSRGDARERPRIAFVGRSMERKGGWRLLALHQAVLRDRCDLDLVTLDPVEARPGVRVRNDISPGKRDLDDLLAAADIFAFPSLMDLSPNVVLEAMAAGLPVVAFDTGAIGEMVVDGVTGHLVPAGDDVAFGAAIEALLADPGRGEAMGRAGRARVLERFDARMTTATLLDVLDEARGRHALRHERLLTAAVAEEWA